MVRCRNASWPSPAADCSGLQRVLLKLDDERSNVIAVSVAWVRMPNTTSARHFKRLVDAPGTGSITPIADEAGVQARFAGRHYTSRQTGSVVVVAEAAAGGGRPDPAVLDGVADVAAEFPGP